MKQYPEASNEQRLISEMRYSFMRFIFALLPMPMSLIYHYLLVFFRYKTRKNVIGLLKILGKEKCLKIIWGSLKGCNSGEGFKEENFWRVLKNIELWLESFLYNSSIFYRVKLFRDATRASIYFTRTPPHFPTPK